VRVSAAAEAGRVILDWDHALDPDENHKRAAKALAFKLNWNGDYVGGHLPQKNAHHMCFVRQDRGISPEFTIAER
jgi:hypothetical protein